MMRYDKQALAAGLLAALLGGCAGPRMLPPSDVTRLTRAYEAVDRSWAWRALTDESFRLGPYAISAVKRDEASKKTLRTGGSLTPVTISRYAYELSVGADGNPGSCNAETKAQFAAPNGGTSTSWDRTELTCKCGGAKLRIFGKGIGLADGTLELDGKTYRMTALSQTDNPDFDSGTVGFRADREGKLLGAVELLYPGKVWLSGDLGEGQATKLACLFVGTTLYVPPFVPAQQD